MLHNYNKNNEVILAIISDYSLNRKYWSAGSLYLWDWGNTIFLSLFLSALYLVNLISKNKIWLQFLLKTLQRSVYKVKILFTNLKNRIYLHKVISTFFGQIFGNFLSFIFCLEISVQSLPFSQFPIPLFLLFLSIAVTSWWHW